MEAEAGAGWLVLHLSLTIDVAEASMMEMAVALMMEIVASLAMCIGVVLLALVSRRNPLEEC